jgi:hypothetical protein
VNELVLRVSSSICRSFAWSLAPARAVAIVATMSTVLALGYTAFLARDRRLFLPGATTSGHYQIEIACAECHTPFGGVDQKACERCHAAQLDESRDTHPASKFLDPRNAERLTAIDALHCVTCHREHAPEITVDVGVTQPIDYCSHCHRDIAAERPSHAGFSFASCSATGCHNFHDNRALWPDFIAEHLDDPVHLELAVVPLRSTGAPVRPAILETLPRREDSREHDAPRRKNASLPEAAAIALAPTGWIESAHALSGLACADCHGAPSPESGAPWEPAPDHERCRSCHESEVRGYLSGRHGMRLAVGLSALVPGMARLPVRAESLAREHGCATCHRAHRFDTRAAAVEACLECHDDEHSRAYIGSPHHELWLAESRGTALPGSGVSCATCHLPRVESRVDGNPATRVIHDQNDNLRPPEKMVRNVCLYCHGLGFSLDAIADPELARRGHRGIPARRIESIDMVRQHAEKSRETRSRNVSGEGSDGADAPLVGKESDS